VPVGVSFGKQSILVGYFQQMRIAPEQLPLHLSTIDGAEGDWIVAVRSALKSQSGDTILLRQTLEQQIDEEHFRTRELGMTVYAPELYDPDVLGELHGRVSHWIETTEGDGFLDLTHGADHA
jgi:hypothetical protein